MRMINMYCPNCGAVIQVDMDEKNHTCNYCGHELQIYDEMLDTQGDNSGEEGYSNEQEREISYYNEGTNPFQQNGIIYDYMKLRKRRTWLWVLGWLFVFPLPLTILMNRSQRFGKNVKIIIIAASWLLYLLIVASGISDDPNKKVEDKSTQKNTEIADVETEKKETTETEEKKSNPESIVIQADKMELILGETAKMTIEVTPVDAAIKTVEWKSSDESVLKVDNNGVVTAVGGGKATISATVADNIQASCEVTVDGTKRLMHVHVTHSRSDDVNIGNEWTYYDEIDGESTNLKTIFVGDTIKFYSKYIESDDKPDVGEASTKYTVTEEDIKNGFSVTMDLYVTENGGRNRGKKAHFVVTYQFSTN